MPRQRQSPHGTLRLALSFTQAGARTARKIATNLRARGVHPTHEAARSSVDTKRAAVALAHAHVSVDAVESHEIVGALSEAKVVIARDGHEGVELGKAAGPTREAFWNVWHASRLR